MLGSLCASNEHEQLLSMILMPASASAAVLHGLPLTFLKTSMATKRLSRPKPASRKPITAPERKAAQQHTDQALINRYAVLLHESKGVDAYHT